MKSPRDCQNDADYFGCDTFPDSINELESNFALQQGNWVMLYWPDDDAHNAGTVNSLYFDGYATIHYDIGDVELLSMNEKECVRQFHFLNGCQSCITFQPSLNDAGINYLALPLGHFGNKAFLEHEVQIFPQYTMYKTCKS